MRPGVQRDKGHFHLNKEGGPRDQEISSLGWECEQGLRFNEGRVASLELGKTRNVTKVPCPSPDVPTPVHWDAECQGSAWE